MQVDELLLQEENARIELEDAPDLSSSWRWRPTEACWRRRERATKG
jgi:hypothetical protein